MHTPPNTVLVIDDESQIRRFVSVGLELHGYSVRDAKTGSAGLNAAAHTRPDVIILDIRAFYDKVDHLCDGIRHW